MNFSILAQCFVVKLLIICSPINWTPKEKRRNKERSTRGSKTKQKMSDIKMTQNVNIPLWFDFLAFSFFLWALFSRGAACDATVVKKAWRANSQGLCLTRKATSITYPYLRIPSFLERLIIFFQQDNWEP